MSEPSVELNNGLKMPLFGLGTWLSAPNEVYEAVKHAIATGYRHIDTATIYGNEAEVGQAITDSKIDRKDLFLTTKLWNSMHAPEDVPIALERSLKALQTDYLDLWLMHYPCANDRKAFEEKDESIKVDIDFVDTWKVMEQMVKSGKVKSIGISNFCKSELEHLMANCTIKPQVHQMEMHPYLKQEEFLQFHKSNGIHVTAYSAFGNQNPTYNSKEPKLMAHEKLVAISERTNEPSGNLLIAWAIKRGTSVIPKSVTLGRIEQNFAGKDTKISDEDFNIISDLGYQARYGDFGPYIGYWYYRDLDCPGKKPTI